MTHIWADRIADVSTTTGTRDVTLLGTPPQGYKLFSSVLSTGDTFRYCIVNRSVNEWETGRATCTGALTFARTTFFSSSTGSPIDFAAGTKDVWINFPASIVGADEIIFVFDGGGSALSTGFKGSLRAPWDCLITSHELICDQSATLALGVRKCTYAQYDAGSTHPVSGDSIVASAAPSVTAGVKATDSTLTGWTKNVSAGDWLHFYVDSNDSATLVMLSLQVIKT
jgi:hypothetical protein